MHPGFLVRRPATLVLSEQWRLRRARRGRMRAGLPQRQTNHPQRGVIIATEKFPAPGGFFYLYFGSPRTLPLRKIFFRQFEHPNCPAMVRRVVNFGDERRPA